MSVKCSFQTETFSGAITDYDSGVISFGFTTGTVILNYQSGGAPVNFSFNGSEDHGIIFNTSGYMKAIELNIRTNRIWLKGGDATTIIDIWAIPNQG